MERYQYKIGERHLQLVREQVWETGDGIDVYSDMTVHEFNQIEQYLGRPKVVLDICSGLGRASIAVNQILKDPSVLYILADQTGRTPNTGVYAPEEDEIYNDLALATEFCNLNGIERVATFDTRFRGWHALPAIDLVISTVGLGFHVPLDRYLPALIDVASETCVMIFGCRAQIGLPLRRLSTQFQDVRWLPGVQHELYPREDWLILRGPL